MKTKNKILVEFGRRLRLAREAKGLSQEEAASRAGLDRTYVGGVERGERNISLLNIYRITDALDITPSSLVPDTPTEKPEEGMNRPTTQELTIFNVAALSDAGLTAEMVAESIVYTYQILDGIDSQLVASGAFRMTVMFELANISSMIGNLIGAGIANASGGTFKRTAPHNFPDLEAQTSATRNVEIKVALETNAPKGHHPKPGYYLTYRYVLCGEDGVYTRGIPNRGSVVWIWEVRFGWLDEKHFGVSNTAGDSGKTAPVNAAGMEELKVVFCDLSRCPRPPKGKTYKRLKAEHPDTLKLL